MHIVLWPVSLSGLYTGDDARALPISCVGVRTSQNRYLVSRLEGLGYEVKLEPKQVV